MARAVPLFCTLLFRGRLFDRMEVPHPRIWVPFRNGDMIPDCPFCVHADFIDAEPDKLGPVWGLVGLPGGGLNDPPGAFLHQRIDRSRTRWMSEAFRRLSIPGRFG